MVTLGSCISGSARACAAGGTRPFADGAADILRRDAGAWSASLGPCVRALRARIESMFSNDERFEALRKRPVQICSRTLFISSSKKVVGLALYSTSGSFWP
jgi:hypothetical protein